MGSETKPDCRGMVQNFWTLALFPGLMKTRLGFGPRGTRAEPRTVLCICSSFSNPYRCTTSSHEWVTWMLSSQFCERTPFLPATLLCLGCNHDPRVGKVNRRVDSHSWVFVHTFFFLCLLQLLAKSVWCPPASGDQGLGVEVCAVCEMNTLEQKVDFFISGHSKISSVYWAWNHDEM